MTRRRAAVTTALIVLAACKGKQPEGAPPATTVIADAAPPPDASLDSCRIAAAGLPKLPPTARAQALLDACHPCGDWQPLLQWNNPPDIGGPPRSAIEQAMLACNAYCEPEAKQRFLGALDAARGQDTRGPWRHLGEVCKAAVSAVPDTRFMGAPYFALDRIARALGDAALLAKIQLPLPALSVSGVGVTLPTTPALPTDAGPAALTVLAADLQLGALPIATLAPDGVHVTGDYPGPTIELKALAGKLAGLGTVAVVAPRELPAARLVAVIAAAGGHALQLTVGARGPGGWSVPGAVPIALVARQPAGFALALDTNPDVAIKAAKAAPRDALTRAPVTITLAPGASVANLATLLGALGYFEVKAVALVASPKP